MLLAGWLLLLLLLLLLLRSYDCHYYFYTAAVAAAATYLSTYFLSLRHFDGNPSRLAKGCDFIAAFVIARYSTGC